MQTSITFPLQHMSIANTARDSRVVVDKSSEEQRLNPLQSALAPSSRVNGSKMSGRLPAPAEAVLVGGELTKFPHNPKFSRGLPENRFFRVVREEDEIYLEWKGSSGQKARRSAGFKELKRVSRGQTTAAWDAAIRRCPELVPVVEHCFSLVFEDRSIDISCPSALLRDVWVSGLQYWHRRAMKEEEVDADVDEEEKGPKRIEEEVVVVESRRKSRGGTATALRSCVLERDGERLVKILSEEPEASRLELSPAGETVTVLCGAAGWSAGLRVSLTAGGDLFPRSCAWSVAHAAAAGDWEDTLDLVLQYDAELETAESTDAQRRSPLLVAAAAGAHRTLQYLVLRGGNTCLRDARGRHALHCAAEPLPAQKVDDSHSSIVQTLHPVWRNEPDKTTCVRLLLDSPVYELAGEGDRDGRTCLHLAASSGHTDMCRAILGTGVSPLLLDSKGVLPSQAAELAGHMETFRVIDDQKREWMSSGHTPEHAPPAKTPKKSKPTPKTRRHQSLSQALHEPQSHKPSSNIFDTPQVPSTVSTWSEIWSHEHGMAYFYNHDTQESQWEDPRLESATDVAQVFPVYNAAEYMEDYDMTQTPHLYADSIDPYYQHHGHYGGGEIPPESGMHFGGGSVPPPESSMHFGGGAPPPESSMHFARGPPSSHPHSMGLAPASALAAALGDGADEGISDDSTCSEVDDDEKDFEKEPSEAPSSDGITKQPSSTKQSRRVVAPPPLPHTTEEPSPPPRSSSSSSPVVESDAVSAPSAPSAPSGSSSLPPAAVASTPPKPSVKSSASSSSTSGNPMEALFAELKKKKQPTPAEIEPPKDSNPVRKQPEPPKVPAAPEKPAPPPSAEKPTRKFANMLKMGVPPDAVRAKMTAEGFSAEDIAKVVDGGSVSLSKAEPAEKVDSKDISSDSDPRLEKFRKMLKMGVPSGAVRAKMTAEGFGDDDVGRVVGVEGGPTPKKDKEEEPVYRSADAIRDDEVTSKFAKMLKMGVPCGAVRGKMTAEGVEETVQKEFFAVLAPDQDLGALGFSGIGSASARRMGAPVLPPPPGAGPSAAARAAAKRRTKTLHWEPLQGGKLEQSVWAVVAEDGAEPEDSALEDLESMFSMGKTAVKIGRGRAGGAGGGGGGGRSEDALFSGGGGGGGGDVGGGGMPGSAGLIDGKRANNVEIGLAQFRSLGSPSEIWSNLLQGHGLPDAGRAEALQTLLPTPQEARQCSSWPEERCGELGVCEVWFRTTADLPRAGAKVRALVLERAFDDLYDDCVGKLETVCRSSHLLRSSERLKAILATVLRVGNAMNAGTRHGQAAGFRLESLLKLRSTKATDRKTTLLDYIASVARRQNPDAVDLEAETSAVAASKRVVLADAVLDARQLLAAVSAAKNELAAEKRNTEGPWLHERRIFTKNLESFLTNSAEPKIHHLESIIHTAQEDAKLLADHFAEDRSTAQESIAATLHTFFLQLQDSVAKIQRQERKK